MNNHALKLVKEKGSVSIKIHDLIKMQDEEFSNPEKQNLYEQGIYYHKHQKGILRVSKYEFFPSKESCNAMLKKHPMEIFSVDYGFDYAESDDETKVWYMNFADKEAFDDRNSHSLSSVSDSQSMEMPLLFKVNRFLNTDHYACITPTTYYKDGKLTCPTPILFENVPQWFAVTDNSSIKSSHIITKDKKNNIISMRAPYGNYHKYELGHLYYLCHTLFSGFGGIISQGAKSKIKNFELHTGNWGCGNQFNNNKELIYLSQMIVASVMGIQKIYFHKVDEDSFNEAKRKYELLVDEFNYEELVSYLDAQGYGKI